MAPKNKKNNNKSTMAQTKKLTKDQNKTNNLVKNNISEKSLLLGTVDKKPFLYPTENLKKHFIALGASGSGKTVLSKILLEESAMKKIPSIVVDVQGDLCALAINGDEESLLEKGISEEAINNFKENVEVKIFTPISSKGIPICINPLQLDEVNLPEEEIIPILHSIASSFCKLIGYKLSNDKGKFAEVIIYSVLKYSYDENTTINNFDKLISLIKKPNAKLKKQLDSFISDEKELDNLIRKIKFMNVGEKKLLFQFGVPVDIDLLLGKKSKSGKTSMSIIYLNTLQDQEDKEFFLSALTSKLYQWMLSNPSKELQALYMIDEIAPFIPAGAKKPMTKDILKMLFKQARKYGLGCVIATQNPGDIDYKAFAQFGSWAMGRLTLKQDIKKVDQALSSVGKNKDVKSTLPKLQSGQFVLFAPDISNKLLKLETRWLLTEHSTLDEDEIKSLMEDSQIEFKKFFVKNKSPSYEVDENEDYNDEGDANKNNPHHDENEFDEKITVDDLEKTFEKQIVKQNQSKNKTKGNKLDKFCCFPSLSKDNIFLIAEKKKKKSILAKDEQIVDIKQRNHPLILTKIRQVRKNIFSKKVEEHSIFFDAVSGEVVLISKNKHNHIQETKDLLSNTENQLYLIKEIMKSKQELSILELAKKTSLNERTVSKNLKELTRKGILTFRREGKYKYFSSLQVFNKSLKKLSSSIPEFETEVLESYIKSEITSEEIFRFVRTWFKKAQVLETKLVYLPLFEIVYSKKGKTRTLDVNGSTGKIE